jgi:hypothetical protein
MLFTVKSNSENLVQFLILKCTKSLVQKQSSSEEGEEVPVGREINVDYPQSPGAAGKSKRRRLGQKLEEGAEE